MSKIDVLIPVYKPDKKLIELLERLCRQTIKIHKIILMNTEEKYLTPLMAEANDLQQFGNLVSIWHISQREFDHGGTRRCAVKKSDADIFVMMTQDALPADPNMLEHLISALEQKNVAAAYARQLPDKGCHPVEKYTRQFNYPPVGQIQSAADLKIKGIKTYFFSNVCAAYKRKIYDELGGFVPRAIFNEDMIYAATAIKAGYQVAYAAEARVVHSHNYTNPQQFRRNFDIGVSQAEHPEVFQGVKSEAEGKKMLASVTKYLWTSKQWFRIPGFLVQSVCKYTGYLLGKNYQHLPQKLVVRCSMSPLYWNKY